jgi:hypothetical protein
VATSAATGHHSGYHYRAPVRVVRYERYVEVPPPRVYYSGRIRRARCMSTMMSPVVTGGDHDHDLIKWIGGAIVLGEIIHHTVGH